MKATHNLGSITKIKGSDLEIDNHYFNIMFYSFPCQDLSIAGKGAGIAEGTRSGLVYEVLRLLNELKPENRPDCLIMENVPQIHSKKHINQFQEILAELRQLGYTNKYADMNTKDFEVPQNRNRTFCVSLLGDYYFEFPEPKELKIYLEDVLEDEVDEKYYLPDEVVMQLIEHAEKQEEKGNGFGWKPHNREGQNIASTIKTEGSYRSTSNFMIGDEKQ